MRVRRSPFSSRSTANTARTRPRPALARSSGDGRVVQRLRQSRGGGRAAVLTGRRWVVPTPQPQCEFISVYFTLVQPRQSASGVREPHPTLAGLQPAGTTSERHVSVTKRPLHRHAARPCSACWWSTTAPYRCRPTPQRRSRPLPPSTNAATRLQKGKGGKLQNLQVNSCHRSSFCLFRVAPGPSARLEAV